jgi:hypothetical protein
MASASVLHKHRINLEHRINHARVDGGGDIRAVGRNSQGMLDHRRPIGTTLLQFGSDRPRLRERLGPRQIDQEGLLVTRHPWVNDQVGDGANIPARGAESGPALRRAAESRGIFVGSAPRTGVSTGRRRSDLACDR